MSFGKRRREPTPAHDGQETGELNLRQFRNQPEKPKLTATELVIGGGIVVVAIVAGVFLAGVFSNGPF